MSEVTSNPDATPTGTPAADKAAPQPRPIPPAGAPAVGQAAAGGAHAPLPAKRRRRWPWIAVSVMGGLVGLAILAVALFQWDWLIPYVDRQASAALGRPATITHLHVKLGRVPHIVAEGVTIANPDGWPGGGNFATADKLELDVDAMAYIRRRQVVIPVITLDAPKVDAQQLADGRNNWTFPSSSSDAPADPDKATRIGALRINDGQAHVRSAKLRADFNVDVATKDEQGDKTGQPGQIVASAKGTYAGQPITARFTGGALLSLRDDKPYPVNLQLANGPTKVSLAGTVRDPLDFAGADLKLEFAGPDMALLTPLTGIAFPKTPAYRVAGQLDYQAGSVKFTNAQGKFGSSDLEGNLQVDTTRDRPVLTADLQSRLVDLKDLGGFVGAEPGDATKGTKPAAARSNGRVLPDVPVSLPKLTFADVHLKYKAARIQGRSQPLDNMRADMDIVDGAVKLHPLAFGIGRGQITSTIDLQPQQGGAVRANATIDFQRVDLDRLLSSAGAGRGAGAIGGRAVIQGTGTSLAEILGTGNGEMKLYMGAGGNLSALLVDLSGLQFGNALLSALGVPSRAAIQCFIADFTMQRGLATARTLFLDLDSDRVFGGGSLSFYNEALRMQIKTEAKHFSVGSLAAPINITGTFANPHVNPDAAVVAEKAGAAVALGIVLTPLAALLPTVQLGTGEDNACSGALRTARTPPRVPPARAAGPRAR